MIEIKTIRDQADPELFSRPSIQKTAEEKLIYSQTVKNLSKSLGVFLNFMSDMDLYNEDDMYDDDDDVAIPF